jgi:hypothetical protein
MRPLKSRITFIISPTRYMQNQFLRLVARSKREPWDFDRPMPYSYPRIQLFKLMEKIRK